MQEIEYRVSEPFIKNSSQFGNRPTNSDDSIWIARDALEKSVFIRKFAVTTVVYDESTNWTLPWRKMYIIVFKKTIGD